MSKDKKDFKNKHIGEKMANNLDLYICIGCARQDARMGCKGGEG